MGLTWLLVFLILDDKFRLDDLHVQNLGNAAAHGPIVLFVGISQLNVDVYRYDLEKEVGRRLDKNKAQIMFPSILVGPDGFLLAEIMGNSKLVFLDWQGNYLKRQLLSEFEGWRDDLVLVEMSAMGGRVLANFEDREDRRVWVAQVDLADSALNYLHQSRQREDLDMRFYPWLDGFLEVHQHTGRLRHLSTQWGEVKVLIPGFEPQKFDPKRPLARRIKYHPILWPVATGPDHMAFFFNKPDPYADGRYPKPLRGTLTLEKDNLTEGKTLLLGKYGDRQLHFDPVEKEFTLLKD